MNNSDSIADLKKANSEAMEMEIEARNRVTELKTILNDLFLHYEEDGFIRTTAIREAKTVIDKSASVSMWICESCGAQFRSIPYDEDVKFCSNCVIIEEQTKLINELSKALAFARCVIKSGEEWSKTCEDMINPLLNRVKKENSEEHTND